MVERNDDRYSFCPIHLLGADTNQEDWKAVAYTRAPHHPAERDEEACAIVQSDMSLTEEEQQ